MLLGPGSVDKELRIHDVKPEPYCLMAQGPGKCGLPENTSVGGTFFLAACFAPYETGFLTARELECDTFKDRTIEKPFLQDLTVASQCGCIPGPDGTGYRQNYKLTLSLDTVSLLCRYME